MRIRPLPGGGRQDGGSPYFRAGPPIKQMWPPRPCTATSSKGEGALATTRGEIGGRLGEATLPCGRDKRGRSRWGLMSHAPRPVSGLMSHVRAPVPTSPAAKWRDWKK